MKIVIAPDSFKGSISACEATIAIDKGIRKVVPHANTILVPVADGGEGTTDSLVAATGGHLVDVTVTGPLGEAVQAQYGVLGDGQTCVIEMASASGLILVPAELRNPLVTTTFGTGQLISHALGSGFRRYLFAIGGSATNDGGIGMLQALGLSLTDSSGQSIGFGGGELSRIAAIDDAAWDTRISECQFTIASDVQNPLVGKEGASYVFGPQKGATSEMVEMLDAGMHNWADRIAEKTGKRLHDSASAGAAGGLGAAFQAFFPSIETRRGIDIVIELTQLREHLQGADLVITGEGRIDEQTASGKTPMGIAQEAQKLGIPVVVLAGSVGKGIESLYPVGVTSIHSIMNAPMSLQEAMLNAAELLQDKAEQVVRTFLAR